jgi:hypothetical protein
MRVILTVVVIVGMEAHAPMLESEAAVTQSPLPPARSTLVDEHRCLGFSSIARIQ